MSKKLFITGTGTDVGKTYVTGLLLKKLVENNKNIAYYKAAMSGNEKDENGTLIPGDAIFVKSISKIDQDIYEMCPYIFEIAASPHLASKIEKENIEMDKIVKAYMKLEESYDYITMEGSGGIICPIRYDDVKIGLENIIKELNMPCIIVADAGLGTINLVVLTIEYMKSRNLDVVGIVFNNYDSSSILHKDNKYMCEELTGIKVIACVEKGACNIDIDIKELERLYR